MACYLGALFVIHSRNFALSLAKIQSKTHQSRDDSKCLTSGSGAINIKR